MKVIIPAGGKATRVRPHSYSKSKLFFKIAGKTIIEYLIDHLLVLNPEEFIIVVNKANHDEIKEGLTRLYPYLKLSFPIQEKPLGTAHVILQAKPLIKKGDDIFILFSDTIFKKNLKTLKKEYDGVIYVKEVEDYKRFGVVVHENRVMTKIVEKPDTPISKLCNIGAYYLKDGFGFMRYVQRVLDEDKKLKGEYFLTEAFSMMVEDGKKIYVDDVDDWLDTGAINTILETHCKILNGRVLHGKNVKVENSKIGKNVYIGDNSIVRNCKLENTMVGENSNVEGIDAVDSIIGDNVTLKKGNKYNIGDNCSIV
jgi:glucose-1-phosphate thymidylyltransferase